jgi:hypothetical protein
MTNDEMLSYYIRRVNDLKSVLGVNSKNIFDYVIQRHETESSWQDGLPPIDYIVEVRIDNEWHLGKCISRQSPAGANPFSVILLDGYENKIHKSYPSSIREVEIEENLAKLEIMKIISRVMNSSIIWPTKGQVIANDLWRLGYRKTGAEE